MNTLDDWSRDVLNFDFLEKGPGKVSPRQLKNGEKYFLFHFKNSFRSRDVYIFVLTFWLREKWHHKKI